MPPPEAAADSPATSDPRTLARLDRELGGSPADPWYLSALAVVLLAVLQERWGHPDRAARAREHGRQARELHKEALRELYAWAGSALAAEE